MTAATEPYNITGSAQDTQKSNERSTNRETDKQGVSRNVWEIVLPEGKETRRYRAGATIGSGQEGVRGRSSRGAGGRACLERAMEESLMPSLGPWSWMEGQQAWEVVPSRGAHNGRFNSEVTGFISSSISWRIFLHSSTSSVALSFSNTPIAPRISDFASSNRRCLYQR